MAVCEDEPRLARCVAQGGHGAQQHRAIGAVHEREPACGEGRSDTPVDVLEHVE